MDSDESDNVSLVVNWTDSRPFTEWNNGSDDMDKFWTPYQRSILQKVPRHLFTAMGVYISCIFVVGLIANSVVLYVFSR